MVTTTLSRIVALCCLVLMSSCQSPLGASDSSFGTATPNSVCKAQSSCSNVLLAGCTNPDRCVRDSDCCGGFECTTGTQTSGVCTVKP